ncbi:MAG: Uncharacterized protein G01um10148_66 [Parcubacteria group bacterium Gr01-1014_8]|nr:MAG: Uncharacterized protein G01um10148_66 [Parcubacteria group bacterium Gr01-1014_8]
MRSEGKSYAEIFHELKIPRSTLSGWLGNLDWSTHIKKRLSILSNVNSTIRLRELNRIRGLHLIRVYEQAKKEAGDEFKRFRYHPLFISGVMLYWGEGDKRSRHHTRLINTDPEMIKLFSLFLRQLCRIPDQKIKAALTIYPDLDEKECRKYWSWKSGIDETNFTKSMIIQGRHKTNRLSYGMCTILVTSTYLKVKMLEWLQTLPQELMKRQYYESIGREADMV